MSTRVTTLTLGGLDQLSAHARRCVFWEMDPAAVRDAGGFYDPEFEKEAWLSMVMLQWGSCAQVATLDDKPAGSAFYAPPNMVPRAHLFPTSPVSADAILLTTVRIEPLAEDSDLGAGLIRAVISDLIRRNVRAIEAFGYRSAGEEESDVPGATAARDCSPAECMIEAGFLEDMGFEVVAPHHRFPRLRLELDRDHEWKIGVEAALDRLLEEAALTVAGISDRTPVGAAR
ncbi:GNAT family N-acetyltransferase [Rhodococcus ruber]